MQEEKLNQLQNDVIEFYKEIKEALSPDAPYNDDYFGYNIFYSPIIYNPKILFIGINPGGGEKNISCHVGVETFEYIDGGYTLANETIEIFQNAMKYDLLVDRSVKTNYYYLISNSENELYGAIGKLPADLQKRFYTKGYEFTKQMIECINPEFIICEGTGIYDLVQGIVETDEISTNIQGCYLCKDKSSNVHIVGYSRRFSNIRNKEGVATVLKQIL